MKSPRSLAALFARDALVSTLVASIAFGPAALPVLAGPENAVHGSDVTIVPVDATATAWLIIAPDGSVIEYSSFDIAANETVRFFQTVNGVANDDARVLNRILSALPTHIEGTLTGNGHIYIVNQAGVFFHDGATVNANGIHAAGGHLSDADFANRVEGRVQDHYTGVTGDVTNAADIIARAVGLVGAHVENSGSIDASDDVILEDGWIVIAAGNDVIIGRDDAAQGGRGLLLRVEGAAGAVFQAGETGVTNTGTLDAGGDGTVRIGAGDLYGTAIFSDSAIRAREIALAAGNRGDIALANQVSAEKVDISFRGGATVGELRGTTTGAAVTVQADELKLSAADTGAEIRVSDEVSFRSQDDARVGPNKVTLEQNATLASSRLETLDIGANTAGTTRELALRSTGGNVVIDNKAIVSGSHLALAGTLADIQGTDALNVASLAVTSATTAAGGNVRSAGDLVASTGGISVAGNLELTTKPSVAGDPPVETLVSAHQGTLDVDGNVSTSAGGGLRIEARDVVLGTTSDGTPTGTPTGGAITSRGDVTIGFVEGGVEQTEKVVTRAIDTRGASQQQGGNVAVSASGNVTLGAIATNGGFGSTSSQPNQDGGSVTVRSTGDDARVVVGAITTGGASGASAAERGAIELEAEDGTVVLGGGLSATGGQIANADHARDRAVKVTADEIELDSNALSIAGSDVTLAGSIVGADVVSDTDPNTPTARRVDLGISASGVTTLGSADLGSLAIASTGESVVLGGNVVADTTVRIGFNTSGIGTISNGGASVTVEANRVELAASDASATSGRAARVALGDGIAFDLSPIAASEGAEAKTATLVLDQDATIDSATASGLATAGQLTTDLTLELRSNDAVTLDDDARVAVTGTDLVIASRSFAAIGATQLASDFDLSSLNLTTTDALDVDFGVTADSVHLEGALGGTGDLTLRAALQADTIELLAGNGTGGAGNDSEVVFESGASLSSQADAALLPTRVELIQDAALDSAELPDVDTIFGGSVAGLQYVLQSRDGSVTLSAGSFEKFEGSALELRGQTGVNLGSDALSLASLIAETPAGLVVANESIEATDPDGKIRLHAGSDGTGNLEVSGRLAASKIELVAGSGNGSDASARIQIQDGARFSAAGSDARPDTFVFEQDAAIGPVGSNPAVTALPDLAFFGGDIAGMDYTLRSNGASVRIDETASVNGSILRLDADTGIDINGNLNVAALDLIGGTSLSGNIVSEGDVTVTGALSLDGTGDAEDQSVSAGTDGTGDLNAGGAISKTGAGAITLSGQNVDLLAVTTGHAGDSLTISGVGRVDAGTLDASGAVGADGGDVTVSAASGSVVIASITTRGGSGPVSETEPTDGHDGGNVLVTGSAITIGSVNTSGGSASAIATSDTALTRAGGDAGAIVLGAPAVTLKGNLDARGGAGAANDPNVVADHTGDAGDVSVHGSILLDAVAGAGGSNVIRGNNVTVDGGVSRAPERALGQTTLLVFAENSLSFGDDLSAGRIELEVANGDLDLAAGGVSQISADTIRLAATDGNGGNLDSEVILTGLTLENELGDAAPKSLTVEQDASIGVGGSPLPAMNGAARSIALISHDGGIEIDGASIVGSDTLLTLAANGLPDATGPVVIVTGGLDVAGLTIGTGGASSVRVDGDARIEGDLALGTGGLSSFAELVDVTGAASIAGNATFARTNGTGDQGLHVGPGETLTLGGAKIEKTSAGKLTLDADAILLTRPAAQTIENTKGQLEIGSASGTGIVKGSFDVSGNPVLESVPAGLTLRGAAEAGTGPAVIVHGTRTHEVDGDLIADGRNYAIAVADGNLTIDARVLPTDSTTPAEPATWSVDGDILVHGDAELLGRGVLAGGQENYVIGAERAALTSTSRGGELRIAGIASADGDVVLHGEGDAPNAANPNPSGIFTSGDFDVLDHNLTLADTTEIAADTALRVRGDVVIESDVRGTGGLSIESNRVLFTSTDETQTIQAGSLSFASNGSAPPLALPSVFRDGDLELSSTNGDVQFASGQQLIVAGDLDVSSNGGIVLADTAALTIDLNAPTIQARGGSDVVANSISLSNRPSSLGGSATFATPTREQISGDIAGADVLLRQISNDPVELTQAGLAAGNFPTVDGPAFFVYATQVPHIGRPAGIVRPRADLGRLAEVREARPLWADELLFYLDARSRRAPSAREQGALPPVSAGPNATTPDSAREAADPAVEQAIAPYRALFRPTTEVDPETGIVQGADRAPEIRAAFANAVQVAASSRGGATPTAGLVAAVIERDPSLAEARAYRTDLGELVAAANRALDVDQRARFRELLLARVAPQNISAAEFDALIP